MKIYLIRNFLRMSFRRAEYLKCLRLISACADLYIIYSSH